MRQLIVGAALFGIFALAITMPAAAERTVVVPMAKVDVAPQGHAATAVLAGGCFWGMEAVFSHLKGVKSVTSGYAGGTAADATYDRVSTEGTRHAEAVRIVYDPAVISYATLLRVYFSVAHNPTEVNRQAPTAGCRTVRRSFRSRPTRRVWPKPISRRSTRRKAGAAPSRRGSKAAGSSQRKRITRILRFGIPTMVTSAHGTHRS